MRPPFQIFPLPANLAFHVVQEFIQLSNTAADLREKTNIALSGGSTPKMLFQLLSQSPYRDKIKWEVLHFFWSDERCVPPDHPESNYGMTQKKLLQYIKIPNSNIHRIKGESLPDEAAHSYSTEIYKNVPSYDDGIPRFDWILLGVGDDGHTASLFPGSEVLYIRDKLCAVAVHPVSGQHRITMTLPLINHAKRVTFLVTGKSKRKIVFDIFNQTPGFERYPAAHVNPVQGKLVWLLDKAAAKFK